jgi:hypothetical protein
MGDAHHKWRARVNDCIGGKLADYLGDWPLIANRATGLEHGVREMARLRNAARRSLELDVGFLYTTDPTRAVGAVSAHRRGVRNLRHRRCCGSTSSLLRQLLSEVVVGIGASVFLIAVGAILTFAVHASVSGIAIHTVGVILMIAGALGLIVTLTIFAPRRRAALVESTTTTHTTPQI